jgi:uncharacterized protein (DUF1330 family)
MAMEIHIARMTAVCKSQTLAFVEQEVHFTTAMANLRAKALVRGQEVTQIHLKVGPSQAIVMTLVSYTHAALTYGTNICSFFLHNIHPFILYSRRSK